MRNPSRLAGAQALRRPRRHCRARAARRRARPAPADRRACDSRDPTEKCSRDRHRAIASMLRPFDSAAFPSPASGSIAARSREWFPIASRVAAVAAEREPFASLRRARRQSSSKLAMPFAPIVAMRRRGSAMHQENFAARFAMRQRRGKPVAELCAASRSKHSATISLGHVLSHARFGHRSRAPAGQSDGGEIRRQGRQQHRQRFAKKGGDGRRPFGAQQKIGRQLSQRNLYAVDSRGWCASERLVGLK